MKANGQSIKPRRRFVQTTDSNHDQPIFPNLYRNVIPAKLGRGLGDGHNLYPDRERVLLPGRDPGEYSITATGDYWITDDTAATAAEQTFGPLARESAMGRKRLLRQSIQGGVIPSNRRGLGEGNAVHQ